MQRDELQQQVKRVREAAEHLGRYENVGVLRRVDAYQRLMQELTVLEDMVNPAMDALQHLLVTMCESRRWVQFDVKNSQGGLVRFKACPIVRVNDGGREIGFGFVVRSKQADGRIGVVFGKTPEGVPDKREQTQLYDPQKLVQDGWILRQELFPQDSALKRDA